MLGMPSAVGAQSSNPVLNITKYVSVDGENWEDADTEPYPVALVPGTVWFKVLVSNSSDKTLTNIVLTDDTDLEFTGVVTSLAGGESDCSDEISAPSAAGSRTDIATVTAEYRGLTLTATDPATYIGIVPAPSIDIEKYVSVDGGTTWEDADDADDAPEAAFPGSVWYKIVVTNTGNVDLTDISVSDVDADDKKTGLDFLVNSNLAPGESDESDPISTDSALGVIFDLATVSATDGSTEVEDSDPAYYAGIGTPYISIIKEVSVDDGETWYDANEEPGPTAPVPGTVKFKVTVINTGNVPLNSVTVSDDTGLVFTGVETELEAGESDESDQISQSSALGINKDTATVTGIYNGAEISASDPAHYFGEDKPSGQPGTLKIHKYWDKNGNKKKDCCEPGLDGWTYSIVDSEGNSSTAETDNSGWIVIEDIEPGSYMVTEIVQEGWEVTTGNPQTAVVNAGEITTLYFGNKKTCTIPQNGTISIFKYWDKNGNKKLDFFEPGLGGWTYTVVDPNGSSSIVTTNNIGWVVIKNLAPGSYTVTETVKDGWEVTTGNPRTAEVKTGKTTSLYFGNKKTSTTCQTGSLKIYKYWDKNGNKKQDCREPGLGGWTFIIVDSEGSSSTATTDRSGWAIVNKLTPGSYTVTETIEDGWVVTTGNPRTAEVTAGKTTKISFGNKKTSTTCQNGSLKIFKYWDKNGNKKQDCREPGLGDWTFTVTASDGSSSTAETNKYGWIVLKNLEPGNYTISESVKDGWTVTTGNPRTVEVISGKTTRVSFGNKKNECKPQTGALVIYKFWDKNGNGEPDCGEPSLEGRSFDITAAEGYSNTSSTGDDGWIVLTGLTPGEYTVTEQTQEGWTVTTGNPQTGTVKAGRTKVFFFGNQKTASQSQNGTLKIYKYWDKNGNKKPDCGESGLGGWTFTIKNPDGTSATAVTDDDGWIVLSVTPGKYTVIETVKPGWVVTTANPQRADIGAGATKKLMFGNKKSWR